MVEDVFGFCCQHSSFHHDGRPRPIYHSSVHVQFLIREFFAPGARVADALAHTELAVQSRCKLQQYMGVGLGL